MIRLTLLVVLCSVAGTWAAQKIVPPVVGGHEIDISETPYQISMRYNNRHRCGGSIFSDHIIVTAAHCVVTLSGPQGLSVVAGSTTLSPINGQQISVARFIVHPKYYAFNNDYDVAILVLKKQFKFSSVIKPIPLAKELPLAGSNALISGWGYLIEDSGVVPNELQGATVQIISMSECKKSLSYRLMITDRMICAGHEGGGVDACQGDSGGPLVINKELVGIVSWGNGCAKAKYPGLYSSVPKLYPWIIEAIRNNSINYS